MRGCGRTGRHLHNGPRPRTRLCGSTHCTAGGAADRAAPRRRVGRPCLVPVPQRDGEATTGRYHDEPPARSKNEQASQPSDVHTNTSRYTGRYSMSAPTPAGRTTRLCTDHPPRGSRPPRGSHPPVQSALRTCSARPSPSAKAPHHLSRRRRMLPPLVGRQIGILLPSSEAPHSHAPRAHHGACASAPDEPRLTTPRLTTPRLTTPRLTTPRMMPPCLTTSLRPHLTWPWPCLCLWQRPPRRRPFWRPPASRPRPRRPPRRPLRRRRPHPPPLHPRRHRR